MNVNLKLQIKSFQQLQINNALYHQYQAQILEN